MAASRFPAVEALIPPLSRALHKGHHGRVGVLGGSFEYCGAPFYAAMTAYKMVRVAIGDDCVACTVT